MEHDGQLRETEPARFSYLGSFLTLESPSRLLAFPQYQQGDHVESHGVHHQRWAFGEERVERIRSVAPEGIPIGMVRAVRTNSELDGAALELLLSVVTTVENLVGSHTSLSK